MDLFTEFSLTEYSFLRLAQGGIKGNSIIEEYDATGYFKARDGVAGTGSVETPNSASSMHIRPTESFIAVVGGSMIGHGIRCTKNGLNQTYRIIDQVEGFNPDTGLLEFYRLILKREELA